MRKDNKLWPQFNFINLHSLFMYNVQPYFKYFMYSSIIFVVHVYRQDLWGFKIFVNDFYFLNEERVNFKTDAQGVQYRYYRDAQST